MKIHSLSLVACASFAGAFAPSSSLRALSYLTSRQMVVKDSSNAVLNWRVELDEWVGKVQEEHTKALEGWFNGMKNDMFPPAAATLGDPFPNLVGSTQMTDDFDLYEYLGDSWGVVFMHPGDFTPVCTTELGRAAMLQEEFEARGAKLCGFSCNDSDSHNAWIEDIKIATGGEVTFPIFCDPDRTHAVALGILDPSNKDVKGIPLTVRSVYILKPDKKIALMITYPASTGRNFDEILRALDSVQLTANNSVATPVEWKKGDDVIVNFPLSNAEADELFGKDGYNVIHLPSEEGKDVEMNYLRYTKDPSTVNDEIGGIKGVIRNVFRKK